MHGYLIPRLDISQVITALPSHQPSHPHSPVSLSTPTPFLLHLYNPLCMCSSNRLQNMAPNSQPISTPSHRSAQICPVSLHPMGRLQQPPVPLSTHSCIRAHSRPPSHALLSTAPHTVPRLFARLKFCSSRYVRPDPHTWSLIEEHRLAIRRGYSLIEHNCTALDSQSPIIKQLQICLSKMDLLSGLIIR